jgi:ferrous iron transport protein B
VPLHQFINDEEGLSIDASIAKDFVVLDRFNPQTVGYVIFFVILFVIFQSIFEWSKVPMDFIDSTFASLST